MSAYIIKPPSKSSWIAIVESTILGTLLLYTVIWTSAWWLLGTCMLGTLLFLFEPRGMRWYNDRIAKQFSLQFKIYYITLVAIISTSLPLYTFFHLKIIEMMYSGNYILLTEKIFNRELFKWFFILLVVLVSLHYFCGALTMRILRLIVTFSSTSKMKRALRDLNVNWKHYACTRNITSDPSILHGKWTRGNSVFNNLNFENIQYDVLKEFHKDLEGHKHLIQLRNIGTRLGSYIPLMGLKATSFLLFYFLYRSKVLWKSKDDATLIQNTYIERRFYSTLFASTLASFVIYVFIISLTNAFGNYFPFSPSVLKHIPYWALWNVAQMVGGVLALIVFTIVSLCHKNTNPVHVKIIASVLHFLIFLIAALNTYAVLCVLYILIHPLFDAFSILFPFLCLPEIHWEFLPTRS